MGEPYTMTLISRFAVAAGSGGLAILAFPPVGWWPVALVAWAVLMLALRGAGFRQGFYLGLLHGVVFYAGSLSWLWHLFSQASVGLWVILALFPAMAGGVVGWAAKRHPLAGWLPWFAASAFAALGYVRAEIFWLRFPWMTPGLGLGPTWVSPWIGVYGAGFLVLLAGGLLVFGGLRWRAAGVGLTVALAGLGLFRPPPVEESGAAIPLLAVQSEACDFVTYHEMTMEQPFEDGIILWPEYAAPALRSMRNDYLAVLELSRERRSAVVLGTIRPLPNKRHFNEALTLENGEEAGAHFKNHPVHFFNDGVAGTTAEPVATRFGMAGTPICFDCDYAGTVRRMTAAGAEFFVVPSMDAEHWSRRQHLQHAEIFRHRALENGRWMAVCATSGLTQLIDPHGNRVAALPLMEEGVLRGELFARNGTTFYTRVGWRFPQVVLGAWLASCLVLLVRPLPGPGAGAIRNGGGGESGVSK